MFDGMAHVFYSPWLAHATDVGNVHSCKSIRSLSMKLPVFFTFILISFDLVSFYLLYFSFVALIRIIPAFLRREKHFST